MRITDFLSLKGILIYPSDITDAEWQLIEPFFRRPDPRGNQGKHSKRDIINAILYVVQGGIPWRMLPNEFRRGIRFTIIFADLISEACGNTPWMHSTKKAAIDTANNNIHPMPLSVLTQYASDECGFH
jgi:transposase